MYIKAKGGRILFRIILLPIHILKKYIYFDHELNAENVIIPNRY